MYQLVQKRAPRRIDHRIGRKDHLLQTYGPATLGQARDEIKPLTHHRKGQGGVFHHVGILAHLAGEQECQLALQWAVFVIDTVARLHALPLGQLGQLGAERAKFLAQITRIRSNHRQPHRASTGLGNLPGLAGAGGQGDGQALARALAMGSCVEAVQFDHQIGATGGGKDKNFFNLDWAGPSIWP